MAIARKIISFTDDEAEMEQISEDMKNGWAIINLVQNDKYYLGIMEKDYNIKSEDSIYIRPRLKLKISTN